MAYCPKCGENAGNNAFCSYCGTKINTEISKNAPTADPYRPDAGSQSDPVVQPEFPMKWHKFMIYFALWANAVSYVFSGFALISVSSGSDIFGVLGFASIVMAIWVIYLRYQIAGLRTGAPKKLLIWMIVSLALGLISALGTFDGQSLVSVVISAAYLVWNWRYYTNREELFVN